MNWNDFGVWANQATRNSSSYINNNEAAGNAECEIIKFKHRPVSELRARRLVRECLHGIRRESPTSPKGGGGRIADVNWRVAARAWEVERQSKQVVKRR